LAKLHQQGLPVDVASMKERLPNYYALSYGVLPGRMGCLEKYRGKRK